MKMDGKWIIVGGIGSMAIGLVGTVFFMTGDFNKTPVVKNEAPVVSELRAEEKVEKKVAAAIEPVMTSYLSLISPVGTGTKEFPETEAGTFKEELLALAAAGEIDALLDKMNPKLDKYRFSEEKNLEIAGLYADASFTKGLVGKTEDEMRKYVPNGYKTPEMLALMPLYMPELARRDIIRDNLSLTPLTEGAWNINGTRYIENKEDADEDESYGDNGVAISMFNVVEGLHKIHVVSLNLATEPDVEVRAYIAELANGQLQLYGYYIPDGTTHYYQTVEFFKQMDEEYLIPNEQYQQEEMQKEIKAGNIPEEALEAFLNPTK